MRRVILRSAARRTAIQPIAQYAGALSAPLGCRGAIESRVRRRRGTRNRLPDLSARAGDRQAGMGGTLPVPAGETVRPVACCWSATRSTSCSPRGSNAKPIVCRRYGISIAEHAPSIRGNAKFGRGHRGGFQAAYPAVWVPSGGPTRPDRATSVAIMGQGRSMH